MVRARPSLIIVFFFALFMTAVVAEVIGRKDLPLDELIYPCPLLLVKDLHLWGSSTGPRFIFGIGVSQRL